MRMPSGLPISSSNTTKRLFLDFKNGRGIWYLKENIISSRVQIHCRPRVECVFQQRWTFLQCLGRYSGNSSEWGPVATHAFAVHEDHTLAHRSHVKNNWVLSVWLVKVSLTWQWTVTMRVVNKDWREWMSEVPFRWPGYLVPGDSMSILERLPLNSPHAFLRVNPLLLTVQFDLFRTSNEVLIS
jgi:hypothetical protein